MINQLLPNSNTLSFHFILEAQDFNKSKAVRSRTKLILRAYKTELRLNNQ
jgi:hypothetical protein